MTFEEFVKKYNGKATDYDGGCGVQCVDLAKLYMDKVCNVKIGAIGNAEAYWRRYNELSVLNKNFDRIANTPEFIPQKGDIVVWDTRHGKYGHIAVADGIGTTSYFYSYDQNWGGKGQGMTRIKHSYKSGFAGVLRPKKKQKQTSKIETIKQGDFIEINTPMLFTGAIQGTKYMYDTRTELTWISFETKTLIKNDRLIARATFVCYAENDTVIVQVFNDQFKIKKEYIVKKL